MLKKTTLAVAATTLLTMSGGCGGLTDEPSTNGVDVNNPDQAFAKLARLPNIDEAVQRYQEMSTEIRNELSAAIPKLKDWKDAQDGVGGAGCLNNDGETQNLSSQTVRVKISDQQFDRALQIVGRVAGRYGFSPRPNRNHDAPGNHDTSFMNPTDRSEITFGTDKTTLLGITVGCHLTAEAKKRSHPSES